MLCDNCKAKPAVVHVKQASDGAVREMHLCRECAAEKKIQAEAPMEFTDFLFGLEVKPESPPGPEPVCLECGMSRGEFQKRSRLGCSLAWRNRAGLARDPFGACSAHRRHNGIQGNLPELRLRPYRTSASPMPGMRHAVHLGTTPGHSPPGRPPLSHILNR